MAFDAFRDLRPFSQLIFATFVILVSFLLILVISFIVAIPIFGSEAVLNFGLISDFEDPETLAFLKYFQTMQSIGLFILPPFILGYLFYGNTKEYLHLNKPIKSSLVLLIIALMFFAGPFINLIGELNNNMVFPDWLAGIEDWMKDAEENAAKITEAFVNVQTIPALAFNVFMIAFLPAIGEELLFRGVIQRIFTNMTRNHHWGIWISAFLFSALHMQFYGFVPRVLLGAIFGYMLVWSGSMWLPILSHFLNNAIAVVGMFLIHNNYISPEFEEFGSKSDTYYGAALSLVIVLIIMRTIKTQNAGRELLIKN